MRRETGGLRRALGLRDLVLLKIVAILNFSLIPVVSVYGRATLLAWLLAFCVFCLPSMVAVVHLSRRYPEEGGVYLWAERQFGSLHGFVSGWCYWTNNLFYIPMQLVYIAGMLAFAGADPETLGGDKRFVATVAFGWLALATIAHVRGLQVGKWVQNAGALATMTMGAMIVVAALAVWWSGGVDASQPARVSAWEMLPAFSVMCLSFVGIELASTMGSEIRRPRRSLPRAVVIAGAVTLVSYLVVTWAVMVLVPSNEVGIVQGLMQAVERGASRAGIGWIVAPVGVVTALSIGGAASAWFAGSSRVPFVAGIGRAMPSALGKVHPRWGSPHVAILVSGALCAILTGVALAGSTVTEAYRQLLNATVILQMVPFLYVFGGLVRLPESGVGARAMGVVGLISTALATGVGFVPPPDVADAALWEAKLILGVLLTLGVGLLFYWRAHRTRSDRLAELREAL